MIRYEKGDYKASHTTCIETGEKEYVARYYSMCLRSVFCVVCKPDEGVKQPLSERNELLPQQSLEDREDRNV